MMNVWGEIDTRSRHLSHLERISNSDLHEFFEMRRWSILNKKVEPLKETLIIECVTNEATECEEIGIIDSDVAENHQDI